MEVEQIAAHLPGEYRRGQRQSDPDPSAHIREFGVWSLVGGDGHRLQRHAADRAAARPDLANLRMHRAGVDRLRIGRRRRRGPGIVVMTMVFRHAGLPARALYPPRAYCNYPMGVYVPPVAE